jgi:putative transposase
MMRGKKIKGRKRHLLVDTMGLVIEALVHTAGIQDRDGGRFLVSKAKTNGATFHKGFADGGYAGKFIDWAKVRWDVDMEVVKRNELHKFVVLPKRWIVERTNAWISRYRRLAKDFERFGETVRNWIFLAMTRLMLKRLAKTYG